MSGPYEGMNAILYSRVSTDDKGQNPQQQIEDMRSWCKEQGVQVMAVYVDEGKTGANMDRPGMMQVMGRAMMGGISLVIAQHPDRISRDAGDLEAFRKKLQTLGVNIRYTALDVAPETEAGRFQHYFHGTQGESWLKGHSVRVKLGMDFARKHGPAPGKKNIGRPRADINIDLVMELADAGYSLARTAMTLGYARATLIGRLHDLGRYDEFYDRCRKGGLSKTTARINTKEGKTGGV